MWPAEDGCDYKERHDGAVQLLAQLFAERLLCCEKCTVSDMLQTSNGRNWIGLIWRRIVASDGIL
jgi:hypothetical protein